MIQHRQQLFAGRPNAIAMVPGDHYLSKSAVARMLGTLSSTSVDVVILGTWAKSYHEEYGVSTSDGRVELVPEPSEATFAISALGTYVMSAEWLERRLDTVPVDGNGHCDLTTDVIFGKDQSDLPRIAFEPLQDNEQWEDVGTIHRLYGHIRSKHPISAQDEQGNINLSDMPVAGRATNSVIYFGATNYASGHANSFIANNFVEQCA
jgi:ADP-glucose pyrophosphorylase